MSRKEDRISRVEEAALVAARLRERRVARVDAARRLLGTKPANASPQERSTGAGAERTGEAAVRGTVDDASRMLEQLSAPKLALGAIAAGFLFDQVRDRAEDVTELAASAERLLSLAARWRAER